MKLQGLRVVDLSLFLPGPNLSLMMSDQGAEVIKVESVGEGEPNRRIGRTRDGVSVYFAATHRGKKSVALNLKDVDARRAFHRLIATTDVVIEAFRPGVAQRLGIDYLSLKKIKPDLVYVSISAFGQDGPLADRPAHDLAVEATCGLLSNNVDADGRPCLPAMPAGDMLASALALSGVLMALYRRQQTGAGDYLDLSLMDAIFASMPNSVDEVFVDQRAPVPQHQRAWGGNAMYRIYRTKDDKYIVLGGAETKFAHNLLNRLGRLDLLPLCEAGHGPHQRPVIAFFEATFAQKTQADWVQWFADLDVCFAPVNDLRAGFDLAQTAHRRMLVKDAQGHEHIGTPFKFANEPGEVRLHVPALGQHTREVLRAVGLSEAELDELIAKGAAAASPLPRMEIRDKHA
jgi:crotonobetainyl-CoA:carnitine CoA-transferase CaiB-like acyl-CoA transferase